MATRRLSALAQQQAPEGGAGPKRPPALGATALQDPAQMALLALKEASR